MAKNIPSITLDVKLCEDTKIEAIRRKMNVSDLVEIAIRREIKK